MRVSAMMRVDEHCGSKRIKAGVGCMGMNRAVVALAMLALSIGSIAGADLSIMTYNVYFDDVSGNAGRYPRIVEQLGAVRPNVIALQEVTRDFRGRLDAFAKNNGYALVGDIDGDYGVVFLTNLKVESSAVVRLPSRMGRYGLRATLVDGDRTFTVITAHLDSMLDDTEMRKMQLSRLLESLPKTGGILLGDCNFGDGEPENDMLASLTDAAGGSTAPTYDVIDNAIARRTRFENERSRRLDRILLTKDWTFNSYTVHRNEHSDHYAISLTLK